MMNQKKTLQITIKTTLHSLPTSTSCRLELRVYKH